MPAPLLCRALGLRESREGGTKERTDSTIRERSMHVRVDTTQRQQFADDGYLVVKNVVDPERDIAPVLAEFSAVLDDVATKFVREGRIARDYHELPFTERLTQICAESGEVLSQYFDISLPQSNVQPDTPINMGAAMLRLLTNPRLLDVAESVIGPEIWVSPVQHIRMKLPAHAVTDKSNGLIAKIPWHQDNGVVTEDADESDILTIWMPLNRATVENGCMQVMPRSHGGGIEPHCPGDGGLHIPDQLPPVAGATGAANGRGKRAFDDATHGA